MSNVFGLKEFVCRHCAIFLAYEELIEGKCPECDSDDSVFINDIEEEE